MKADLEIQSPGITSNAMEAIYLSEAFVVVQLLPDLQPPGAAPNDPAGQISPPGIAITAEARAGSTPMTHHPLLSRRGFEIVDRRSNREVYLDGAWAELFARQIDDWRERAAPREEVEATLEGYTLLAQAKLALH